MHALEGVEQPPHTVRRTTAPDRSPVAASRESGSFCDATCSSCDASSFLPSRLHAWRRRIIVELWLRLGFRRIDCWNDFSLRLPTTHSYRSDPTHCRVSFGEVSIKLQGLRSHSSHDRVQPLERDPLERERHERVGVGEARISSTDPESMAAIQCKRNSGLLRAFRRASTIDRRPRPGMEVGPRPDWRRGVVVTVPTSVGASLTIAREIST